MKNLLVVFGTRPEAIKLCPLVATLMARSSEFTTTVCVTSQHREMLDQVLDVFGVTPHFDLDLMKPDQSLFQITSSCLDRMGKVIAETRPDCVVVQGDTTTTMATALAAYYSRVRVAHVEAGLRTFNKYSPFPEEINRRMTSVITDLHFAPTEHAAENLRNEGVPPDRIRVTGNTVIDALFWVQDKNRRQGWALPRGLGKAGPGERMILMTGHRRENLGPGLVAVSKAVRRIAEEEGESLQVVFPVHLNPNVRKPVQEVLSGIDNVRLIDPVDYRTFVALMDRAYLIISDSGGIQEEAPSLGKPVLVTRDTTERPEAVDAGAVKLVGTDEEKIVEETRLLLDNEEAYRRMAEAENPFGDGTACTQIADHLSAGFLPVEDA